MQVQQPNQFLCYKQTMDFVGRMDQNVAKYKIGIPMKKWRRMLFPWMFDVILQNVWVFYRIKDQDDESVSPSFSKTCCQCNFCEIQRKADHVGIPNVLSDVHYDVTKHYHAPSKKQGYVRRAKRTSEFLIYSIFVQFF